MYYKLVLLVSFVWSVEAYRVLVVAPSPYRSLGVLGESTVRHLVAAGHEVTFITAFPKQHAKGYRQIDVSGNALIFNSGDDSVKINIGWVMENPQFVNDILFLQDISFKIANETFNNKNVRKLLEDPAEEFDVVVSELFETELYAALSAVYKCPLVWSCTMGADWMSLRLIAEATNPALSADYLSPEVPPLDFYGRLNKLWLQIQWSYFKWAETKPKEMAAYEKLLGPVFEKRGRALPSYNDIIYNASLMLANDYYGNGLIPSTPQNFQFIGGYHVERPTKPLPEFNRLINTGNIAILPEWTPLKKETSWYQLPAGVGEVGPHLKSELWDIQKTLDNAEYGFVYFSMGTVWESKYIPAAVTNGLLEVFSELKETVIWKYEDDLPNLPKNIHILKWAPQPSILAHPKCLAFITHGGLLSSIETIHFGVPTIGIPVFLDQFININKAVSNGYAIKVDLTFNLHKDLRVALKDMLTNSTYKERAKELSQIYHDRPVPPGAELVHWVEHVVRTRGAPHLRSPALMLPWYQKIYLDLAAIIIAILGTIFILFKRLCKICNSRKANVEKKRN